MERRREQRPGERTGLVRKVTNVALSEIAGDAGAPFAAVTSGLPMIWELSHKRTEKVEGRPLLRKSGYLYLADVEWCYLEIT